MADRARDCGLVLRPDRLVRGDEPIAAGKRRNSTEIGPDACGPKRDSMTLFYRLLGPRDRKLGTREGIPINPALASSVKVRSQQDASYTPPGLAEWLASGKVSEVGGLRSDQVAGEGQEPDWELAWETEQRECCPGRELLRLRTRGASAGAEQLGRR